MIYRAIRTVTKSDLQAAFANTREVIAFESWLGLPFEDNLQRWLLDHPSIIKFLNHYYVLMHFPVAIGLLLFLYLRHQDHYRFFRNLMAFVTFVGLIIHLAFPLAPPRMMTGFVDTMSEFGPEHLPEERARRSRQSDRSDAVAALRLGADRCDRGHSCVEDPLALPRARPPVADGAGHHRHRQPLVARRCGPPG